MENLQILSSTIIGYDKIKKIYEIEEIIFKLENNIQHKVKFISKKIKQLLISLKIKIGE